MFESIKNLFKKAPEEKPITGEITCKTEELLSLFKRESSNYLESLKPVILEFYSDISSEFLNLKQKLKSLENANLGDDYKSLPDKVKTIVDSHRDNYIKRTSILLERVIIPSHSDEILSFISLLDKELDEFSQSTFKSYRAAQHLFFEPVESIFVSIKSINTKLKEFKLLLEQQKSIDLTSFESEINSYIEKKYSYNSLDIELKQLKSSLNSAVQELNDKKKHFETYRASFDYQGYLTLMERKIQLELNLRQIETSIKSFISILDHPLKKLAKITLEDEKTINNYLSNPVISLISDSEKKYIQFLEKLKNSSNKLSLGDKKEQKLVETVNDILNNKIFENLRQSYDDIIKQISYIDVKLSESTAPVKESVIKSDLVSLQSNVSSLETEVLAKEKYLATFDISNLKSQIQERFLKVFNISLKLYD